MSCCIHFGYDTYMLPTSYVLVNRASFPGSALNEKITIQLPQPWPYNVTLREQWEYSDRETPPQEKIWVNISDVAPINGIQLILDQRPREMFFLSLSTSETCSVFTYFSRIRLNAKHPNAFIFDIFSPVFIFLLKEGVSLFLNANIVFEPLIRNSYVV